MLRLVLVLVIVASLASAYAASPTSKEWPAFRGPSQDSIAHDTNRFEQGHGLAKAWQQPLGPGYSSISVSDGFAVTLYGGEERDFAVAFDAKTGEKRWSFDIGAAYKGNGGSYDGPLATPAIDGGHVYALGPVGDLFALDLKTGKKVFHFNLKDLGAPEPYFGFTSSPLIAGNVLVLHTSGKEAKAGLMGFDKKTGKQLWSSPSFDAVYDTGSLLTLFGKQQVVVAAKEKVVGVDPQTGQELWELKTDLRFGGHLTQIGDDKMYLHPSHYQDEGMLIQLKQENNSIQASSLWRTRELGKGAGMVLHHNGYLYGYSGKFLTCIDLAEGKRQWKSRPPGEGFMIMIEDHLAIISRKGSVHLIEAGHEEYKEKASLAVFEETTYNPPSYANGKLYVRSMKSIAAIDLGRAERSAIADSGAGVLPESQFAAKVAKWEKSDDPKEEIEQYLNAQTGFPIIEGDRYAHIVFQGPVEDAAVSVQSLGYAREFPMKRVGKSDLFYYSLEIDPAANVMYAISTDYQQAAADPRNPNKGKGMWRDDALSLLTMPGFSDSNHLSPPAEGAPKGRIEEIELESKHTEKKRPLKVYLPHGYDQGETRYPTVYVDYGFLALDYGLMANTLDQLIGKQIQPMVVVFIPPQPNRYAERDFGQNGGKLAAMIAEEIVPHIDSTYRTRADRSARGILSHYGLAPAAVHTALKYPKIFSKVAVQSGLFDPELEKAVLADTQDSPNVAVHLEWGSYDHVDDSRRPVGTWNARFSETLKNKGVRVQTNELPLAQGWGNWRTRQDDLLAWLFPLETN
ncbi:outer membrane protein assembly factor BamB family protein [Acanthopleuribacter pedis]|uniref:PQQ-binding-like beta-propeller repeat protein n=1 Tax=Acanthopleuribacter pedis TaxID=442870 RepID=A0A8J7QB42_9BACT|nr:PQQ-binding-like beta-propeller repeat protein [Acanthopleuribacter pedis]MBO1320404.1 PQQ-binding-like beta-propeller repeat protein [Acanthopleuribacter pedis]